MALFILGWSLTRKMDPPLNLVLWTASVRTTPKPPKEDMEDSEIDRNNATLGWAETVEKGDFKGLGVEGEDLEAEARETLEGKEGTKEAEEETPSHKKGRPQV